MHAHPIGTSRLLSLLLAAPLPLVAQAMVSAPLTQGALAFDAKATVGDFTGTTTAVTGAMTGGKSLTDVRGHVEAPARSLTTKNDHRDRDMASSMEFTKYATIGFDLDSVSAGAVAGDSTAVTLHGRFTLHGQTHPADIPGWAWLRSTGARYRGAVTVNVKDYGVGGLSKAFGIFKMNEKIIVRIDVTFGS